VSAAPGHSSAYVTIRQHTPAYVSIHQHPSAYVSGCTGCTRRCIRLCARALLHLLQPLDSRKVHRTTSAYVISIRQAVCIRQHPSAYPLDIRKVDLKTRGLRPSAYVSMREHT
jgi:hypothetical protein